MSRWFDRYGFAEVHPGLIVGAYPLDAGDVARLELMGVRRVLNLAEDAEYGVDARQEVAAALRSHGIAETRMSLVDFGRLPADRLERAVATVVEWMDNGERAYVHCRAGWQRSAAVAAGVVAIRDGLSLEDALRAVRERKPTADPLPHQRADLAAWWAARSTRRRAGAAE